MRLTSIKECRVAPDKLTRYLLNPRHADGAAKAAFFARCGFSRLNSAAFGRALEGHASVNEIAREETSEFGVKYIVDCRLETPAGLEPCIRVVWIDEGDDVARLVTAYPK